MEFFESSSNLSNYSCPGLYSVYCVITQNGIFGESPNIYQSLFNILLELMNGEFEGRDLQSDFNTYGLDCFRFNPVDWGEEFNDPALRKKKLQELNNLLK